MTESNFGAQAREVLERIYVEACGSPRLGSPLLTLPAKSILKATDGKFEGMVFVELRTVIDLIKAGLPNDNRPDDG